MDRTCEFFAYLKAEKPTDAPRKVQSKAQPDAFMHESQEIRDYMRHSEATLSTLRSMVEGANVLSEYDEEIQNLVGSLNKEFFTINGRIDALGEGRSRVPHIDNVVKSLKKELKELMTEFNTVNNARIEKIKKTTERRRQFGIRQTSPQLFDTTYNSDEVEIDTNQSAQMMITEQRDRLEQVRVVESMVQDIAKLFEQLGAVVVQADESIMRIDENTAAAEMLMEEGLGQMKRYWERVQGNRWLMIRIFAILLVFALIFILIV